MITFKEKILIGKILLSKDKSKKYDELIGDLFRYNQLNIDKLVLIEKISFFDKNILDLFIKKFDIKKLSPQNKQVPKIQFIIIKVLYRYTGDYNYSIEKILNILNNIFYNKGFFSSFLNNKKNKKIFNLLIKKISNNNDFFINLYKEKQFLDSLLDYNSLEELILLKIFLNINETRFNLSLDFQKLFFSKEYSYINLYEKFNKILLDIIVDIYIDRDFIKEVFTYNLLKYYYKYSDFCRMVINSLFIIDENYIINFFKFIVNDNEFNINNIFLLFDNDDNLLKIIKNITEKDLEFTKNILSFKNTSPQHQEIKDFIQNHNSGSCLFSGYRGVGKTSLIKSVINEVKKENKIIEIIVNIPELDKEQKLDKKTMLDRIITKTYETIKDKKGIVEFKKELDKKTMLDRIITKTYETIKNKKGIDDFKKDIEYHYKRVYNDVKNTKSISSTSEITKIEFFIKNILKFIIFLEISFLIIVGIGFILLNFDIYIYNYLSLKYLYQIKDIPFIKESLIPLILGLGFFYKKWKINEEQKQEIEEIYTPDIAEDKLVKSINDLYKKEKIKIVFVIDELDKLLDFEKLSDSKEKQKIDMKQVFEVLGKLKTLFFETTGALFFVVTNKQAYDYYLQNKHQEDDMISNIFNKVIYLPMSEMDNFNLNYKVSIVGSIKEIEEKRKKAIEYLNKNRENKKIQILDDKEKEDIFLHIKNRSTTNGGIDNDDIKELNSVIESEITTKLTELDKIEKALFREKLKKYFYLKSHGNWRKSKFELSQMITGDVIEIDREKFDFEYKFYEFFDKLYQTFEKGSLDIALKQIAEEMIKKGDLNTLNNNVVNNFLTPYIRKVLETRLNEINENIYKNNENKFYFSYLLNIKNLINDIYSNNKILDINDQINFYIDNEKGIDEIDFFGYYNYSINRISSNYAYRDYILNYLLNIFENIYHYKKINFQEILKSIKINENDLKYPVFTDLIVFWLPLMLIYFNNIEIKYE